MDNDFCVWAIWCLTLVEVYRKFDLSFEESYIKTWCDHYQQGQCKPCVIELVVVMVMVFKNLGKWK